jgi:hypothetical protein
MLVKSLVPAALRLDHQISVSVAGSSLRIGSLCFSNEFFLLA